MDTRRHMKLLGSVWILFLVTLISGSTFAAECHMETWIHLSDSGPMFSDKARLTNARSDHTRYRAHSQEIPAIYTNGPWPWINFLATEGWAE